jgi:hypothetical protein
LQLVEALQQPRRRRDRLVDVGQVVRQRPARLPDPLEIGRGIGQALLVLGDDRTGLPGPPQVVGALLDLVGEPADLVVHRLRGRRLLADDRVHPSGRLLTRFDHPHSRRCLVGLLTEAGGLSFERLRLLDRVRPERLVVAGPDLEHAADDLGRVPGRLDHRADAADQFDDLAPERRWLGIGRCRRYDTDQHGEQDEPDHRASETTDHVL